MMIPHGGILIDEIWLEMALLVDKRNTSLTSMPDLQYDESPSGTKKNKAEDRRRNILGKKGRW